MGKFYLFMRKSIIVTKIIFPNKIKDAAKILAQNGTVAFPTETVYGLGANALDKKAVKKIFVAKGRPGDNPLIVHIANKKDLNKLVEKIPANAEKLIDKFWPGPLTIVLKKSKIIPKIVTAGLNTVAIRMPSDKVALALIKEAKIPIAAPSANLSGRPSPTKFEHVFDDLNGKIDAIVHGKDTKIGVESTVIDLSGKPTLLRPGKVTLEQLEKEIGKIKIHQTIKGRKIELAKSPGMKYKHYSPKAKVILFYNKKKIKNLSKNKKIAIIYTKRYSPEFVAKNLFKKFREFDKKNVEIIFVEAMDEKGLGLAIMNRLKKASSKFLE